MGCPLVMIASRSICSLGFGGSGSRNEIPQGAGDAIELQKYERGDDQIKTDQQPGEVIASNRHVAM